MRLKLLQLSRLTAVPIELDDYISEALQVDEKLDN